MIAPCRRLIAHLQVRLAEAFPALLNLRFFHHDSLARAAWRRSGPSARAASRTGPGACAPPCPIWRRSAAGSAW